MKKDGTITLTHRSHYLVAYEASGYLRRMDCTCRKSGCDAKMFYTVNDVKKRLRYRLSSQWNLFPSPRNVLESRQSLVCLWEKQALCKKIRSVGKKHLLRLSCFGIRPWNRRSWGKQRKNRWISCREYLSICTPFLNDESNADQMQISLLEGDLYQVGFSRHRFQQIGTSCFNNYLFTGDSVRSNHGCLVCCTFNGSLWRMRSFSKGREVCSNNWMHYLE
jgi:hypothetical protein